MQVYIYREEYERMFAYAKACSDEIGMMGATKMIDGKLVITKIYLSKQEVNGGTCELDPADLGRIDYEATRDNNGDLITWIHSHVNMGTSPSSQDDMTFDRLIGQAGRCIAIIINKRREISARFGHSGSDLIPASVTPCTVSVVDELTFTDEDIKAEIKKYVTKKTYQTTSTTTYSSGSKFIPTPKSMQASWQGITLKGMYYFEKINGYIHIVKVVDRNKWTRTSVEVYDYLRDYPSTVHTGRLLKEFTLDNGKSYYENLLNGGDEDISQTDTMDVDDVPEDELNDVQSWDWWEESYRQAFGISAKGHVDSSDVEDYYELCSTTENMVYNEFKNWKEAREASC